MRILFLTYHFPTPREPGAARPWVTAQLLRELGHEVTAVTAGTHYMTGEDTRRTRGGLWSRETIAGIRVIKTFAPSHHRHSFRTRIVNYLVWAGISLLAGLRERRADVVLMATDPPFIMPVGFVLAKLHRAALILDERDLYPETAVALGHLRSKVLIRLTEQWQQFFRHRSLAILAATPGIKELLTRKGIAFDKIIVLPNVPLHSQPASHYEDVMALRRLHNWDDWFIIIYVGKFGQTNEFWTILKAAQRLRLGYPRVRFVLIGEGEGKDGCRRFCAEHKLANVEFLSAQPRDRTLLYVNAADAGIQSFANNAFAGFALSTKIFDYMLSGKPVLFSGFGDTADLIRAARSGIVVDPEDPEALAQAVVSLLENPTMCETMGANGREYMRAHFSDEQLTRRLVKALSLASALSM